MSIRYILEGEPYDIEVKKFIRSRPIPSAVKPKYHQILYECRIPNGEYILVDAQYQRVLKVHRNISGPDLKKNMDETSFSSGSGGLDPYGYGGYRGGMGRSRGGRSTRRTPPSSGGESGEYGGGSSGGSYEGNVEF